MSSNVPDITIGDRGVIVPLETNILAGVTADINTAFGGGLNPALTTPQGQIASSETAIIGDKNASFLYFVNGVDPAYNSGRMQDAIGRIYYITRIAGQPTVQPCTCSGLAGVVLPVGSLVVDENGILWLSTEETTIPVSGSVIVPFACQNDGPTAGPSSLTIFQAVFGWDSIAPSGDAALGNLVENRAAFEERRALSTGWNSMGPLGAILGGVLSVPDVLDAYVTENDTDSPATIGGVTLAANSLYVCVLGGDAQAVAMAIWTRKMPGCAYNGNTSVTVIDPNPHYSPPAPSYTVIYETPSNVQFYVCVTMSNNANVPADALGQVQQAVAAAFAGADGGTRAKIGSTVYASRYYGPIFGLSATPSVSSSSGAISYAPGWSTQIVSILLGTAQSASFTGVVATGVLTASSVTGTIAIGNYLADLTGAVVPGTTITAQLSGTTGGAGTYQLGAGTAQQTQNVTSEPMTTITLVNDITMNINQAPTVAAANIGLALV